MGGGGVLFVCCFLLFSVVLLLVNWRGVGGGGGRRMAVQTKSLHTLFTKNHCGTKRQGRVVSVCLPYGDSQTSLTSTVIPPDFHVQRRINMDAE